MYYLDTSFVAPAFTIEPRSEATLDWLATQPTDRLYLSSWTAAELAGAIGRKVRTGELSTAQADDALAAFGVWQTENCHSLDVENQDVRRAAEFVRVFDTGLRAADALHLALAERHGSLIVITYDEGLVKAARQLGLTAEGGPTS